MKQAFASNWFYPVAAVLLLVAWASFRLASHAPSAGDAVIAESALVFDAFVSLPLLYWLCFRKRQPMRSKVIGMIAVACCGLWLGGWIVPHEDQVILLQLGWLRPVVLAGLFLVELRLAIAVFRLVFKAETKVQDLHNEGVPPFVARLMLAEARFWRWVYSLFRK